MKKACICASIAVLMTQFAFAADDYSQWTYFRNVILNTRATGAGVVNPVLAFPVLVRLGAADSNVFKNAQANGQDLRFSKNDGTHFPYQIELWNAATRVAAIWVLADSVRGNDSSAYINMYWGNAAAADSESGAQVFNNVNGGFVGVWHLQETANTTTNGYLDATANGNSGTGHGTMTRVAGVIGNAASFNGTSSYISIANEPQFELTDNFTLSAWINTTSNSGDWAKVIDKLARWTTGYGLGTKSGAGYGFVAYWSTGWGGDPAAALGTVTDGSWHHVAATVRGGVATAYTDGVTSNTYTGGSGQTITTNTDALLFGKSASAAEYWTGTMQEVEISKTPRDSNWIRLCYQNQRGAPLPTQTLVSLGPISGNLAIISQPKSQWVAAGANASFAISATGMSPISYRWITATDTVGTASTLTLTAVQAAANNSVYTCLVSNSLASVMSTPCTLHVVTGPVILSQPANQTVLSGGNASFSVSAVGVAPLSYKWVLSPYNVAADTVGNAATLMLTSVQAAADQSIYKCVVRNGSGSAVSNPCTLHVLVLPPSPTIISPAPGAMIGADSVVLGWNKTPYLTTGYLTQIALDSAQANIVFQDSSVTDTTRTVYFALATQAYWFCIKAHNSVGWGPFSTPRKFSITSVSALPGRSASTSFGVSIKANELRYSLPRAGSVCVKLYDITGRVVATPVKMAQEQAGSYRAPLGKITAGSYIMTFEAAGLVQRKTLVVP